MGAVAPKINKKFHRTVPFAFSVHAHVDLPPVCWYTVFVQRLKSLYIISTSVLDDRGSVTDRDGYYSLILCFHTGLGAHVLNLSAVCTGHNFPMT